MPDLLTVAAAVFVVVVWTGAAAYCGVLAERHAAERRAEVERALNRVGTDPQAAMAAWRKVSDAPDGDEGGTR